MRRLQSIFWAKVSATYVRLQPDPTTIPGRISRGSPGLTYRIRRTSHG